jgi:hypothetical protein
MNRVEIGGVLFCCIKKMHKKEGEMMGGRSPSHKLNITDDIINGIILSVIMSVKISHHHTNCPFEFQCNTLCHSLGIYRHNCFIDNYRWIQGWKIISVKIIAI